MIDDGVNRCTTDVSQLDESYDISPNPSIEANHDNLYSSHRFTVNDCKPEACSIAGVTKKVVCETQGGGFSGVGCQPESELSSYSVNFDDSQSHENYFHSHNLFNMMVIAERNDTWSSVYGTYYYKESLNGYTGEDPLISEIAAPPVPTEGFTSNDFPFNNGHKCGLDTYPLHMCSLVSKKDDFQSNESLIISFDSIADWGGASHNSSKHPIQMDFFTPETKTETNSLTKLGLFKAGTHISSGSNRQSVNSFALRGSTSSSYMTHTFGSSTYTIVDNNITTESGGNFLFSGQHLAQEPFTENGIISIHYEFEIRNQNIYPRFWATKEFYNDINAVSPLSATAVIPITTSNFTFAINSMVKTYGSYSSATFTNIDNIKVYRPDKALANPINPATDSNFGNGDYVDVISSNITDVDNLTGASTSDGERYIYYENSWYKSNLAGGEYWIRDSKGTKLYFLNSPTLPRAVVPCS